LEACVDSLSDALKAYDQGADQIELCSRLDLQGLSPDRDLVQKVLKSVPIPIKVMVRPRGEDFAYTYSDLGQIQDEIAWLIDNGVQLIVFGALKSGRLDIEIIDNVCRWAYPMKVTVHKAIDDSTDIIGDCKLLHDIDGVDSILSSGGSDTALEGLAMLKRMQAACSDGLTLIPAGRITYNNISAVHEQLHCTIYHGRRIVG